MQREQMINSFHRNLLLSKSGKKDGYFLSGWSSERSQRDRFGAMTRVSNFAGGSVIDYGCGTGDLFKYLNELGYGFEYLGVDQNRDMVKIAQARYGKHLFAHIAMDEISFPDSDFVFASGVFQFQDIQKPLYYEDLISKLFEKCRKAMAVTLLSAVRHEAQKSSDELYFTPESALKLAVSVSKFWMLDHSYHPGGGDMTVGLHNKRIESAWVRPHF